MKLPGLMTLRAKSTRNFCNSKFRSHEYQNLSPILAKQFQKQGGFRLSGNEKKLLRNLRKHAPRRSNLHPNRKPHVSLRDTDNFRGHRGGKKHRLSRARKSRKYLG